MRVADAQTLFLGNSIYPCTIGRGGFRVDKREGDGGTPIGTFPLRECWYRADRVTLPKTGLKTRIIQPDDGWCDDPTHSAYNTPIKKPFAASHEDLWRDDHAYDVVIPLGYNDAPPVPGLGSAIFLHVMHDDGRETAGCVAVSLPNMLKILPLLTDESRIFTTPHSR